MLDADPEDRRFSFFPLALRAPRAPEVGGLEEGVLQVGEFETEVLETDPIKLESLETRVIEEVGLETRPLEIELFKAESLAAGLMVGVVLVEAWAAVEE